MFLFTIIHKPASNEADAQYGHEVKIIVERIANFKSSRMPGLGHGSTKKLDSFIFLCIDLNRESRIVPLIERETIIR